VIVIVIMPVGIGIRTGFGGGHVRTGYFKGRL